MRPQKSTGADPQVKREAHRQHPILSFLSPVMATSVTVINPACDEKELQFNNKKVQREARLATLKLKKPTKSFDIEGGSGRKEGGNQSGTKRTTFGSRATTNNSTCCASVPHLQFLIALTSFFAVGLACGLGYVLSLNRPCDAMDGLGRANTVALQLQWVAQAQFAGYYVALDKGFYAHEGLTVTVLVGGSSIAPAQVLVGGGADAMLNWMPSALAAREKGLPVVNIAQPFKKSGLMLTCWKDTNVQVVEDLRGKTISVWFNGFEYPFLSWMSKVGISTNGGAHGVTVVKQGLSVDPLLNRKVDCISSMTYNEYGQVLDAGVDPDKLITFKYEDLGVATLEDGIYVLEDNLKDPVFVNKMVRFVRASMLGWKYAEANPEEAAGIILDVNDEDDGERLQNEAAQVRMMGEIAKLTAGSNGALDVVDYDRTVATLLLKNTPTLLCDFCPNFAISALPTGAWTHAITDVALK